MKMQLRWFQKISFLLVILLSLINSSSVVLGQDSNSDETLRTRTVTLREFGYEDVFVYTPNSIATYFFQLPADWELVTPLNVDLQIQTFVTGAQVGVNSNNYQAVLELDYNSNVITTMVLGLSANHDVTMDINNDQNALVSRLSDGRQRLDLLLNTNFRCDGDLQAGMFVDADSSLTFTYRTRDILTDLGQLPKPIYQNSLTPDAATLIIPNVPDEAELSALFAFIAGLGRDTDPESFSFSVTTSNLLTDEQRQNTHLIYIGKSGRFAELLNLPLVANTRPDNLNLQQDDGILQIMASPWNSSKVLLFISGETDTAIIKAGETASSEHIRTSSTENLAIISDVEASTESTTRYAMTNQRFGFAGYELVSLVGAGQSSAEFTIYVDPDSYNGSDYSLDLEFSHSNLINYEQSGVELFLNDTRLSTLRLSDETADGGTAIIPIPHSQINAGNNILTISPTLERLDPCLDPTGSSVWFNILPESMLVQSENPDAATITHFVDLSDYPRLFTANPRLDDTVFVVPTDNLIAWQETARIAYQLGSRARGSTMSPKVIFGDAVTEELVGNQNILVVGQAHDIPFVSQLGDTLPAVFPPDSNFALEQDFQLAYRLTPDKEIGYLQLAESPYGSNNVIMTVLGSSDVALTDTVSALINPSLSRFRQGTLQVVENGRLIPVQMTINTVNNTVPTPTPAPQTDPFEVDPINPSTDEFQPPRLTWVVDVAFYSTIIIFAIMLFLLISRVYFGLKKYFADRD